MFADIRFQGDWVDSIVVGDSFCVSGLRLVVTTGKAQLISDMGGRACSISLQLLFV